MKSSEALVGLAALAAAVSVVHAFPIQQDSAVDQLAVRTLSDHPFADPSAVRLQLSADDSISASPDILPTSGAFVTLSWDLAEASPARFGQETLYIAHYLEGEDVQKVAPIKYVQLSGSSGAVQTQVVNMRKAAVFYLCKGPLRAWTVLAKSNPVSFKKPLEPTGGRLSLTGTMGEMMVSWTTGVSAKQGVQYGVSSGSYEKDVAADHISTYSADELCGAPGNSIGFREPGMFYSATLKGLEPNRIIFYRFGSEQDGWSAEYQMRTPPSVQQNKSSAVKVLVVGDMGTHSRDEFTQHWGCPPSRNTTDAMLAEVQGNNLDAGLVLHVGDLSYAVGYASVWDQFHEQIAPISSQIPWMVALGNHERDWPGTGSNGLIDSGGECGVPTELRFRMPWNQRIIDKPWYSFNYGPIHFSVLSSEHDFEEQYPWMKEDLSAVDRSKTPWVVVSLHRPVYIDSINYMPIDGDQTIAKQLRLVFEDLFMEHEVDLVLAGHHHSYQRSCPLYQHECKQSKEGEYAAPVYVISGNAGFSLTPTVFPIPPKWMKVVDIRHHGYTRITADKTSFTLEYVRGDDRQVHDTVVLKRH